MKTENTGGPLKGVRILDLGTMLAGPWVSTLLADLGAEVLKVEIPGAGDPLRTMPPHKNDVPLWWKVANRNKKGITLDLRAPNGRAVLQRLLADYSVLVENFRAGTLDGWGITKEWLHSANPRLTILRITGFGQTGPYRKNSGFARILEAMSGFTNLCGEPDRAPIHIGFPIADSVGAMFGAIGILSALYYSKCNPEAAGQEIDCSLFDSMFRLMDFLPIEYDQLGIVRQRSGNRNQYAAPSSMYRTGDGRWVSIAASSQRIYQRLCRALNRPDLMEDPRFAGNPERVRNSESLDAIIAKEITARSLDELRPDLNGQEVGFSPVYDISDIFSDPHVIARQAIISVKDEQLGEIKMQAVVPRFSDTPGGVRCAGPSLGQHNDEIYGRLGLDGPEQARLRDTKVI